MRDDQKERLKELSESATDDLIGILEKAINTGLESKDDRGNKAWLYKMGKECATIVSKLDDLVAIKEGKLPPISATPETQAAYEEKIMREAEEEAQKRRQQFS